MIEVYNIHVGRHTGKEGREMVLFSFEFQHINIFTKVGTLKNTKKLGYMGYIYMTKEKNTKLKIARSTKEIKKLVKF